MKEGDMDIVNALMLNIRVRMAMLEDNSLLSKDRLEIAQETLNYSSQLYSLVYQTFSQCNSAIRLESNI